MALNIVQNFMNEVTGMITTHIGKNVAAIVGMFSPFFFVCLSMYIVYIVYQYMNDPPDIPVMDIVKRTAALALVTTFAFSADKFMNTIVPFVLGVGDDVAKAISGQQSIAAQIDQLINTITIFINNSWTKLKFDWSEPGIFAQGLITIIIVIIGSLPFIITSFAYIIIAKIMISLLLSFGPIFISFAFFPSMRRNFEQWSSQCLNYIFLTALYSAAFSLMIVLINKFAVIDTNPEAGLNFQAAIYLAVVFAACLAVTMEIPALASQLAGGVGISGLVGSKVSGLSSGAAAAAGGAMGGLLGAMGGNKLADKARELRDKGLGSMGNALKNSWHTLTNKGSIRK